MTSTRDASALALGNFSTLTQRQNIGFAIDLLPQHTPTAEQPVLHALNNGPLIVCGRTGSGKTSALIQLALDVPQSTLIIVGIKSEISVIAASHSERFGPVHVVDPWRIGKRTPVLIRDGKTALFRKTDYRQDSRYAHLAGLNPLHLEAAHEH